MSGRDAAFGAALEAGDVEILERLAGEAPELMADIENRVLDAISRQPLATVEWLISKGAPLRIAVDDGFPVMHLAVDREKTDQAETVRLLVGKGADINEKGFNDWTPLHRAAAIGDVPMVRLLLDLGADPTIRTEIDDLATPEEEARHLGRIDTADAIRGWLESHGRS
ncbi:MAG: ankyrin repeat domain-containing protein [Paracoccaceae bacterium]|nr:ankyrin repeat domain-containing protein [Paracoccaceae bacterium]